MQFRVAFLRLLVLVVALVGLGALAGCGAVARPEATPAAEAEITATPRSQASPTSEVQVTATPRSQASPTSEVQVTAAEFSFAAPQTTFKLNTPYRFSVENAGLIIHEWVLAEQGGEGHAHDAHDAAVSAIGAEELTPGALVSREVTFAEAGTYEFACRLPGHYEAGMKLTIQVE